MRVARVVVAGAPGSEDIGSGDVAESARPRLAIVRDDAFYDVEALERALGASIDRDLSLGDPSDFHTRVATLRSAGLYDLDARLLRGERPSSARIPNDRAMLLAPCDTDRASLLHVDFRLLERGGNAVCRIGQARSLLGQDALVGVRGDHADLEVSIAVVIGEDLTSVDPRAVTQAIMGYAIFADWIVETDDAGGLSTVRGISAALGPTLVSRYALPRLGDARATVRAGGETFVSRPIKEMPCSIVEAVGVASRDLELRSGDVVAVGPLVMTRRERIRANLHDPVEIEVEGLGTLRGTPVARR